jgi:hypothetical protein
MVALSMALTRHMWEDDIEVGRSSGRMAAGV